MSDTITILIKDKEKISYNFKVGDIFVIPLEEPAAAGYLWRDPRFDAGVIDLTKDSNYPIHPPQNIGAASMREFTFKAKNLGHTEIILELARPWLMETSEIVRFEINVDG